MINVTKFIDSLDNKEALNLIDTIINSTHEIELMKLSPFKGDPVRAYSVVFDPSTSVNFDKIYLHTVEQKSFALGYLLLRHKGLLEKKINIAVDEVIKKQAAALKEYIDEVEVNYENSVNKIWDDKDFV